MKFEKLNNDKHDLNIVAELIYETDAKTLNFYFKNKKEASKRIIKLLKEKDNSWSHENVYIATGNNNQIFGVMVAYTGAEETSNNDFKAFFKHLNFLDALKFTLLDINDTWISADLDKNDFYISDLAVDEKCRGKGIGTFILKNSLEIAKEKGCRRNVLDVYLENKRALKLYERFGFKIFNEKSIRWFNGQKGVYNMEYKLK